MHVPLMMIKTSFNPPQMCPDTFVETSACARERERGYIIDAWFSVCCHLQPLPPPTRLLGLLGMAGGGVWYSSSGQPGMNQLIPIWRFISSTECLTLRAAQTHTHTQRAVLGGCYTTWSMANHRAPFMNICTAIGQIRFGRHFIGGSGCQSTLGLGLYLLSKMAEGTELFQVGVSLFILHKLGGFSKVYKYCNNQLVVYNITIQFYYL